MDVFHGLGREWCGLEYRFTILLDDFAVLVTFGRLFAAGEQGVEELLHDMGIQFVQLHSSKIRFDVEAYIVPVDFGCAGLHTVQVGASPDDLGDGSR